MVQPAPLGNPPPPGAGSIPLPAFMAPQGGGDDKKPGHGTLRTGYLTTFPDVDKWTRAHVIG
jgi:hypothetical protein